MTNSHISNIEYGATASANNMLVSGNDIERFGDDGIDYNASNILITKNYIHDGVDLADGAHPDGVQGYPGKFSNVVIDSNRVIRQTDQICRSLTSFKASMRSTAIGRTSQ